MNSRSVQWTTSSLKTKRNFLALAQEANITQIKNKKMQVISGEKDYSVRHFTSVLNREKPKNKGENLSKMCQLIFLKIYPQ